MTLIEMVRATRKNGHRYCAVDKNGHACSCKTMPSYEGSSTTWSAYEFLGHFKLTCNWKDSLIDITKLRGIK